MRYDDDIAKILEPYYPEYPSLSIGNSRYPIHVIPSSRSQMEHPNSILGPLDLSFKPSLDPVLKEKGDGHIRMLLAQGVRLVDLPTFCLASLAVDSSGSISLQSYIDTYFNMLRTCETLDQELKDALASPERMRKRQAGESIPAIRLELRDRIKRPVGGAFLFPPEHISSAIGISTLIVYRKKDSFYLLTGKRGKTGVAIDRGVSHVIPACIFQPLADAFESEYDISYNVYREYLEELFSIEEEYPKHSVFAKSKVLENSNILFLARLGEKGLAGLYFTGCTVNLASLRLEVCMLLLIHDPSWYDVHSKGRYGLARFCFNQEWDTLDELTIDGNPKIARASEYLPPGITASGAGAIYLGFECLSKVL